jgi:hypothetical protein
MFNNGDAVMILGYKNGTRPSADSVPLSGGLVQGAKDFFRIFIGVACLALFFLFLLFIFFVVLRLFVLIAFIAVLVYVFYKLSKQPPQ